MTCAHAYSDGAYVLGALSPAERAEYEAHLAECVECRTAVSRLAPMPGLLGRVDPATLEPSPAGPGRLAQLLDAITRQRHRQARVRRWQLAGAALLAAVLAVAGSAVWSGLTGDGSAPPPAVAMDPVTEEVAVTAQVATVPAAGGTEVRMACQYPETHYQGPPRTYRLVAFGMDGSSEQVGSWNVAPGDEMTMTGLTRFAEDELARLELQSGDGTALLTHQVS